MMLTGVVTPFREATVRLTLRGPTGRECDVETIIDTGFTDFLTLPSATITTLALSLAGSMRVTLADASQVDLDVYLAEVSWHGRPLTVSALEAAGGALAGMSLLYGSELRVQVIDGGLVSIDPLP